MAQVQDRTAELAQKYGRSLPDPAMLSGNYAPGAQTQRYIKPPTSTPSNLPDYLATVGRQALGMAGSVISSVPKMLSKSFQDTAKGIYQSAQWGGQLGAMEKQRAATEALMRKYTADYKAGKISKQRFNTLLKGIQQDSQQGADEATKLANDFVSPTDFAAGAATVGSLPFVVGSASGLGFGGRAGELASKVPGVTKNFGTAAGSLIQKQTLGQAAGAIAKSPFSLMLGKGQVAQGLGKVEGNIIQNKPAEAAKEAAWLAVPAGITVGVKAAKGARGLVSKAIFDKSGLFDNIKLEGGKSVIGHLDDIAKINPSKASRIEKILMVAQDNILTQYGGDAKAAATAIQDYIGSKNIKNMTLPQLASELKALAEGTRQAQGIVDAGLKQGAKFVTKEGRELTPGELSKLGAVKSSVGEVNSLVSQLKATKSPEEATKILTNFVDQNKRFYANKQNQRIIDDLINSGRYGEDAAKSIGDNLTRTVKVFMKTADGQVKPFEFKNGYFLGMRSAKAAAFKTASEVAALDRGNVAPLGFIGDTLRKMGISPETSPASETQAVFKKVKDTFVKKIDDLNITSGDQKMNGESVFAALEGVANNKRSVTDLRQLRASEIENGLTISRGDARKILRAYKDSFKGLGLAERGAAGKLNDLNLRINPVAGQYSRVQSAARYAYNPFFKLQESIETRSGVAALSGTTAIPGKNYSKTIKTLEDNGMLTHAGFGAQGSDLTYGTLTSHLLQDQKKTIAAGVETLAQREGKTVEAWLADPKNTSIIQDFKTVVQYPDKGFTSSNMSKMLNTIVFPARYNIKVATFAAKQLAKAPASTQIGIVKSLSDFRQFLDSPEGIKWQRDNSEAIGVFNYFSPLYPINQVIDVLSGNAKTVGDFGSLGGLPFGVIFQVLQGQGVMPQLNSGYINPKTGEQIPDSIPQTARAKGVQLLSDILGTMYNYPGRLVGLPSKRDVSAFAPKQLLGTPGKNEFQTVTPPLSKRDQRRQEVLQAGNTTTSVPNVGPITKMQLPTVPQQKITPIYKKGKGKRGKTYAKPVIARPF